MNMTLTAVALALVAGMTACIEHRPDERSATVDEEVAETVQKPVKLRGLRVYEGEIPCADCGGIYQHLALKGDTAGIFRLTEVYKNATQDGDETIVTSGVWKRYKTKRDDNTVVMYFLSEGSFKDSTRMQHYEVAPDRITQLDFNGDRIDSAFRYTLKLRKYRKN